MDKSKLVLYREKLNLTQEQLSEKANISVRTIQRIEAGQPLKGHTLEALANALGIEQRQLVDSKPEEKDANFKLVKLINLSSLPVMVIPLANILLPLAIMYWKKEVHTITRQIVSLQIIWSLAFIVAVLLVVFAGNILSLHKQSVPAAMLVLLLVNIWIILRNTAELDKRNKLRIKLNFSIL
jgi:transcriptional regulator with XRE-family HTH domain